MSLLSLSIFVDSFKVLTPKCKRTLTVYFVWQIKELTWTNFIFWVHFHLCIIKIYSWHLVTLHRHFLSLSILSNFCPFFFPLSAVSRKNNFVSWTSSGKTPSCHIVQIQMSLNILGPVRCFL